MAVISMGERILYHRVNHGFHLSQSSCSGGDERVVCGDFVSESFKLLSHWIVINSESCVSMDLERVLSSIKALKVFVVTT